MNHQQFLPQPKQINLSTIESELCSLLEGNHQKIQQFLQQPIFTWENLIEPLEELGERLHQFWAIFSHLNAVQHSEALREVYNRCLPHLSDYSTKLSHDLKLFEAIHSIFESGAFKEFDTAQRKVIENSLRDFRLAGVNLSTEKKQRYAKIVKELNSLTAQFEENLLDATHAWTLHITDEAQLKGIPSLAVEGARMLAEQQQLSGWLFTLEAPSYLSVIAHADDPELREKIYYAYVTRASDIGPYAGKWDNSGVMHQILTRRMELAHLLDFSNYAEESLSTKMARTPQQVMDFLKKLMNAALPKAQQEFEALSQFAKSNFDVEKLNAWDIAYFSEKMREANYAISQEELRPYFPKPRVVEGLFQIINQLFDVKVALIPNVEVWDPEVECYALYDSNNQLRSYFYLDLYARVNKRSGAWMDDYRTRRKTKRGDIKIPVAFITCNFSKPIGDQPALFTHDEVVTLFHEFGHALQHMLTTVDYMDVAGLNGIPWDAVEVASQFLENWAWKKESLHFIAKHYQSNEPLPEVLFNRLIAAKNFQAAMHMIRQLEFSLFDFLLHVQFNPSEENQIQRILNEVRAEIAVVPTPEFNRFQHGFAHIFAGGYAAGYYSYKWAEVMASDAFSLFEEKGIFDKETARSFLKNILETGGAADPAELFKKFRGREPDIQALLKQNGIL